MTLTIATSQFPMSAAPQRNLTYIHAQLAAAKIAGADIIHFPEGALSGYAGVDFPDFAGYDWETLRACTEAVMEQAAKVGIWVVLGTAHPLTAPHKPHNSLYLISDQGQLIDRYDKRFCAGADEHDDELAHFTPGDHPVTFSLKGISCGLVICHEYRYPELYRDMVQRGVQLVFHSFHAGNMTGERRAQMEGVVDPQYLAFNPGRTLPEITMPATMISYAANNYLWISVSNTSAPESCFGSFALRPDGVIIGQLAKHEAGLLLTEVDPSQSYYDSTAAWRGRAMQGQLHSGTLVSDPRSTDRQGL